MTKAGYPSQCAALQGTVVTARDESARKVDVNSFEYILPDSPSVPNKKNGKPNGKEAKNKLEEYKEGLRDFQNSQITKLGEPLSGVRRFSGLIVVPIPHRYR